MSYDGAATWSPPKVAAFRAAFMAFLNHVHIDSRDGPVVLGGNLYDAQIRFLDAVFGALEEDIHDIYVLKSRQLGMSTVTRALTVFWCGMHDGLKGAVVLDTNPHKEEARREIEEIIRRLPKSMGFASVMSSNRDSLRLSNGSTILFMSAGTKQVAGGGGLGRGSGSNFVHSSEMCMWANPEGVSSFRQTLSEVFPNRLYIWESTGRGFNQWYDMWREARADDISKRCVFIGWWAKPNQMIPKGTPAFERYGTPPVTEIEQRKIDEVWDRYHHAVTPEQLAWVRRKTNPLAYRIGDSSPSEEDLPDDEFMSREQAWTEDDAFTQSGSSFFPPDKLTEMSREHASDVYTAWTYYTGQDFIDMTAERAKNRRSTQLKVWQEPELDGVYVVAVDPAYGANEHNDRSAIQVLRCFADKIEQVAEFCAASIQPHQLAWVTASLVGYYKNCRLMLEINGPGVAVWQEYSGLKRLLKQGYLQKEATERGLSDIFNNAKTYIYSRPDAMVPGQGSFHWKTTGVNKVPLMERMRDFATNGVLIVRSRDLLDEMRTVTRDGDTIKSEGSDHDDRVLAMAIGIAAWEQQERRQLIGTGRTREFELGKRRLSVQDQLQLLNRFQLDQFFRAKELGRRVERQTAMRSKWQNR